MKTRIDKSKNNKRSYRNVDKSDFMNDMSERANFENMRDFFDRQLPAQLMPTSGV